MGRPARLCKLAKGKLIDSQNGFVDTFNWLVDYVNNLCGDNEDIELTNPTGSNPVVRFKGGKGGPGAGSGIKLAVVDVESGSPTELSGVSDLTIESASDSCVTLALADDNGSATLTIGVHYAD